MITLKQVIHDLKTNSVEATWVDRTVAPDAFDEDSSVVAGEVKDVHVRCHSYADVQMDMLRADLGDDAAQYADLIALVESNIKPPAPISPEERWAQIKAKRDDLTDNGGCLVAGKWFHSDSPSKQQWERMTNKANHLGLADADYYLIGGQQVPWKTMDKSEVILTAGLVRQVSDAMELREAIIFAKAKALDANPTADINTGWPARYESV